MVLAALGVGYASWRQGELPRSVSAMVYMLPIGKKYVWSVWLLAVTALLTPRLLESLPDAWSFLGFLTVVSMAFCALMPLTDNDTERWHDLLGVAAGVLSQVCVLFIQPWCLLVWTLMAVLSLLVLTCDKPWFTWLLTRLEGSGVLLLEILAAIALYIAILI